MKGKNYRNNYQDKEIGRLRGKIEKYEDDFSNHVTTTEKRITKLEVDVSWIKKHQWWIITLTTTIAVSIISFLLDKVL